MGKDKKPEVVATTYYARRTDGRWEVVKVSVHGDGSTTLSVAESHPERRVVRERLRVLLEGVLP